MTSSVLYIGSQLHSLVDCPYLRHAYTQLSARLLSISKIFGKQINVEKLLN